MSLLLEDDLCTFMTDKFSNKLGLFNPLSTGCRQNHRLSGVGFGSARNHRRQVAYAHQIVCGGGEGEHPVYPFHASVPRFPEIADSFYPSEDFLNPFSQALTDGVARMPGGMEGRPCREYMAWNSPDSSAKASFTIFRIGRRG
jgi:hypothetical protein